MITGIETFLFKLVLVFLTGGLIGIERELKSKSAGFRTIMLICMGSFLFTSFSQLISPSTPDRIASNIVTGIGFLGAGVIFRDNNRVNGLTTAASIWVTAALGMGIAMGLYLFVGVATILIFTALILMIRMEVWMDQISLYKNYTITISNDLDKVHSIEEKMKMLHLTSNQIRLIKENNTITICWLIKGHKANHQKFIQALLHESSVIKLEV